MIRIQGVPVVAARWQEANRPVRPHGKQRHAGTLRPRKRQSATKFRAA